MKLFKNILLILTFILTASCAFAYQTIVMNFDGNWHKVYYHFNDRDAIVQFVRKGYTKDNWNEAIVFHSFKWTVDMNKDSRDMMWYLLNDVKKKNSSIKIDYLKNTNDDCIVTWCVKGNSAMPAQCEILRTSQSFEGVISMHYINKNPATFSMAKKTWLPLIAGAVPYQSYFRLDRMLDKALTFEL